jgi:hypothetical protein
MTKATETKLLTLDDLDLTTASDTPFDLELLNTKGVKTGIILQVLGSESEIVQDWTNRQANRIRVQATQKSVTGKDKVRTAEEDDEYIIESSAVRVVGISGAGFEYSKENVKRLVARNVHVRNQVLQASNELGNYSKD